MHKGITELDGVGDPRTSDSTLQKVVDGVSSDWQWYTFVGALERRFQALDPRQRERVWPAAPVDLWETGPQLAALVPA